MPLIPGTHLGPYEILSPLGAGGMGEVYKAKDTRLDRFVAIKVLPEHLAKHPESLARFEREAKAVAALNHPNITGIHDFATQGETSYVVMELLEGESLRTKLMEGPLSPRKATELAIQMAQGLAAAHEKGVIHRDLKPDNLWITKEGRLKILDFGLAKQLVGVGSGSDSFMPTAAISPAHQTEKGMILGTIGYMSPEQVKGDPVDARSDIFSFGAVLFEMLTGKRAFARETSAETMVAILKEDPPELVDASKPIPPGLRRILDHCLEKVASRRFQNAEDLAFALESASGDSGMPAALALPDAGSFTSSRMPLLGALVAGGLLAWGALALFRPAAAPINSAVAVRLLTYSGRDGSPASSPDGKTIAFTSSRDGQPRIWLKQLRGGGEVPLSAGPDDFPRFSPDASSILFIRSEASTTSLYKMSMLGTDIRKVVDGAEYGDWSPDGNRITALRLATEEGGYLSTLVVVDVKGGAEREVARFHDDALAAPRWSPDGSAIAITTSYGTSGSREQKIIRVDVKTGSIQTISPAMKYAAISSLAWLSSEEVVYGQAETVTGNGVGTGPSRAYRQNLKTGKTESLFWSPVSAACMDILPGGQVVLDGISGRQSLRNYALDAKTPPEWLTRGNINDRQPVFSPDGEWVLFSSNRSGNLDLWTVSVKTGAIRSLTDDAAEDWDPAYSPDGKHILWSSTRTGNFEIWMANADGSGAHQLTHDGVDAENPTETKDGLWVVYGSTNPKAPGVWKIHPDGTGAVRILNGVDTNTPEVSPDGQYVVYAKIASVLSASIHVVSLEPGAKELWHTDVVGSRKTVSFMGRSRWTPDGRHIVFTGQDEKGFDGVFIQDFSPGKDTRASRRPVVGINPEWIPESLGLSRDGKQLVQSESERMFSNLMVAEGVVGLPQRMGAK